MNLIQDDFYQILPYSVYIYIEIYTRVLFYLYVSIFSVSKSF